MSHPAFDHGRCIARFAIPPGALLISSPVVDDLSGIKIHNYE